MIVNSGPFGVGLAILQKIATVALTAHTVFGNCHLFEQQNGHLTPWVHSETSQKTSPIPLISSLYTDNETIARVTLTWAEKTCQCKRSALFSEKT